MHFFALPLSLSILSTLSYAQHTSLCGSHLSDANSTSNVAGMNFNTADVSIHSWAVTVASNPDPDGSSDSSNAESVESSIWYDPGNADYSNNTALGYDMCAFFITNLPANTNRLAQSGGCGAAFSQSCRNALLGRARAEAARQTSNADAIDGNVSNVCSSIAASIGDAEYTWPSECREAMGEGRDEEGGYVGATVTSMATTGLNESGLDQSCKLRGQGKKFSRVLYSTDAEMSYNEATRNTWPILSVYMPVANPKRMKSIGNVYGSLNCLRPDSFTAGSRVSPELPRGTPYASAGVRLRGTSAAAVAGLLIGVVVAMSFL